jgi:hypothetical protein
MLVGELEAWKKLELRNPYEVATCAGAEYWEEDAVFVVPVFSQAYLVDPEVRKIREIGLHQFHLEKSTHFNLLVPLYLASCRETKPTGKLISPLSLPHGAAFFKGSHEIPNEVIAHNFGADPEKFIKTGLRLGGSTIEGGDGAITIPVFPRLPVTIILWVGDLEFPARAQMLIDETAADHLGLDAIWATLIMTAQALVQLGGHGTHSH